MEHWKSIVGYEGIYEVSDMGNVRSLKFGKQKIRKPGKNNRGYLCVNLCKDGEVKSMKVHRLVAEAFIPNPNNLDTVNHKDENKLNNAASNLEWMTRADNINYGSRNRRSAVAHVNHPNLSKSVQQLNKSTGELIAEFPSMAEARRVTGINRRHISSCCLGNRKSTGGYIWKYAFSG